MTICKAQQVLQTAIRALTVSMHVVTDKKTVQTEMIEGLV